MLETMGGKCVDCGASNQSGVIMCGGCGMPLVQPPVSMNSSPRTYGTFTQAEINYPETVYTPSKFERRMAAADALGQAGKHAFWAGCSLFLVVPLLLFIVFIGSYLLFG